MIILCTLCRTLRTDSLTCQNYRSLIFCISINSWPGIIPWTATPGKACGSTLGGICDTNEVRVPLCAFSWRRFNLRLSNQTSQNPDCQLQKSKPLWPCEWPCQSPSVFLFQFYLSYHLYIVACAGAGATVIALVSLSCWTLSVPLPPPPVLPLHGFNRRIMQRPPPQIPP